jgi:hypothetical protein
MVHAAPDGKPASVAGGAGNSVLNPADALQVAKKFVRSLLVIWIFQFPRLPLASSDTPNWLIIAPFVLDHSGGVPPSVQLEMVKSNELSLPLVRTRRSGYVVSTPPPYGRGAFRVKVPLIKQL